MRRRLGLLWLHILVLPTTGLAQESLCNPCFDFPAWRSPIPELPPLPEANDLRPPTNSVFYLGNSIANMRELDPEYGARTLELLDRLRMAVGSYEATRDEAADAAATDDGDSPEADPANADAGETEESSGLEAGDAPDQ